MKWVKVYYMKMGNIRKVMKFYIGRCAYNCFI